VGDRKAGRLQRVGIEGLWIIAGNAASVGGSLVLVRVLTELLQPTEYGGVALALTISGLANQLITGGIIGSVSRHWSVAVEQGALQHYLAASLSLFICGSALVAGGGVILLIYLSTSGLDKWFGPVFAAIALAIVSGANGLCSGIQNAARQRPTVALNSALDAWLKIALAAAIVNYTEPSATSVIWGYVASSTIVTLIQSMFLVRLLHRTQKQPLPAGHVRTVNWLHQLYSYAWPFSTWGIFTWAQQASDRWSLKGFGTQADVGAYAVLFQLGFTPIATATGLMVTLLGPILYQRAGDGTDLMRNASVAQTTWRLTWIIVGATLAASVLAFIGGDWFFSFLVAKAFRAHASLLGFMVIAGGLFAAGQVLALRTQSDMTVKHTIPVKIGSAVIGVALNVFLARKLGLLGVTLGAVGFSATYFIWIAILVRRLELSRRMPSPTGPEGCATPC
jgi:O-antigen/teichoic acid export membrane protein